MITNYEYKMAGPYSDIKTRRVVVLTETELDRGLDTLPIDAPVYCQLKQEEFSESAAQLTHETLQFC